LGWIDGTRKFPIHHSADREFCDHQVGRYAREVKEERLDPKTPVRCRRYLLVDGIEISVVDVQASFLYL
jgi:hypothetical protein